MGKLAYKDITSLIGHFKELADKDEDGITATDAKLIIAAWLYDMGLHAEGDRFQEAVTNYILSKLDD